MIIYYDSVYKIDSWNSYIYLIYTIDIGYNIGFSDYEIKIKLKTGLDYQLLVPSIFK